MVAGDLARHVGVSRLQICDLIDFSIKLILEVLLFIDGFREILASTFEFGLKVSMGRVHVVELGLKLQTELDLFFMVFGILHVLFLEFETHLPLVLSFFLQRFVVLLEHF